MASFGKSLKALLEKSGLTQRQLATMADLGQQTVSQYVTGEREPQWGAVCKLADALGVSVSDFRGAEPKRAKVRPRKLRIRVDVEGHPEASVDLTKTLLPHPHA